LSQSLAQGIHQPNVATHELLKIVRTIDAGKVKHEIRIRNEAGQYIGSLTAAERANFDVSAFGEVLAEIAADEAVGPGDNDYH
jgi:hypothetical protein